ncbi:HIT family protein [Kribbella sp. CA-294648]|uniref:HIT family protein n=1 Tax=Kribbella sp. CA-294648 TaxID=3239948 RepID=UPI003D938FEA
MTVPEWPADWSERISGASCDFCENGGQDRNAYGARIFSGEYVDGYLQSADIQRGYTLAIWKGRHIVEPTELHDREAAGFWIETLTVARALMQFYQPLKMNYETLGNTSPHLHTHLLPRYEIDPRPGQPFPLLPQSDNEVQMPEDRFVSEVTALRKLLQAT